MDELVEMMTKGTRQFDNETYRLASYATTKVLIEGRKQSFKNKGWKCRITKRNGPPYHLKWALWVRR